MLQSNLHNKTQEYTPIQEQEMITKIEREITEKSRQLNQKTEQEIYKLNRQKIDVLQRGLF